MPALASAIPPHLRRLISPPTDQSPLIPLGIAELDAHLAGGLALGRLHEIAAAGLGAETGALSAAFTAHLLARITQTAMGAGDTPGSILWAAPMTDLYAPGLLTYGLDPARLLLVQTRGNNQTLQVMETSLRCSGTSGGGLDAVVGEISELGRTAGRRLHLACVAQRVTGFVLRRWPHGRNLARPPASEGSAATTRWRISPAPSQSTSPRLPGSRLPGPPRWQVELLHARGGRAGSWILEVTDAPNPLRLVTGLPDHPAAAPQRATA